MKKTMFALAIGLIYVDSMFLSGPDYIQKYAPSVDISESVQKDKVVDIAEKILVMVYGDDVLKQRPWIVKEHKNPDIYIITGTFHASADAKGGVAEISILKKNFQIIRIGHGL